MNSESGIESHAFQSSLPSLPGGVSRRSAVGLRQVSRSARSGVRLRRHQPMISREAIERRPREPLAVPRAAADRGRAAHGPALGLHAARAGRPAGRAARRPRAVRQGRLGQSSDVLVQGSRRLGRRHARRRARIHGVRLRVDGQSRQQRRVARRAARARPARSSFPTISRPARSPARPSTARASSPSAATTTM